jgi:hypothetical protein
VTVALRAIFIANPALMDAEGKAAPNDSGQTYLIVRGRVESSTARDYSDFATFPKTALRTTKSWERVPAAILPQGTQLSASNRDFELIPQKEYQFDLAFELPPDGEDLFLNLDGAAVGLPGESFRFSILRERIRYPQ